MIAQILDRAVEIVENEKTWGQDTAALQDGCTCAAFAISQASDELDPRRDDDAIHSASYLSAKDAAIASGMSYTWPDDPDYDKLVAWNDKPGRTKDEVIEGLKNAAKEARYA